MLWRPTVYSHASSTENLCLEGKRTSIGYACTTTAAELVGTRLQACGCGRMVQWSSSAVYCGLRASR